MSKKIIKALYNLPKIWENKAKNFRHGARKEGYKDCCISLKSFIENKNPVEKLLLCLYLYPNYKVESRGPYGLILDVIESFDPEVAERLREGDDAQEIYMDLFDEDVE